jgi:CTP-dependent riboflavin kinase
MTALENAIEAMRKIDNAADMNELAKMFNLHIRYIGQQNARGIKKGDTVQWEYKGVVKQGTITKVNRKTIEVVNTVATPLGRTTTRLDKSMITGVVEAA